MSDNRLLAITPEAISTRFAAMQRQLEATLPPEFRERIQEAMSQSAMSCPCESCGRNRSEHATIQALQPLPPELAAYPNDTYREIDHVHVTLEETPAIHRHLQIVLDGLAQTDTPDEAGQILCYLFSMAFYLGHKMGATGATQGPDLTEFDLLFQQPRPKGAQ